MSDETVPGFEEALSQIEQIVAGLERGESDLSAALARYESGIKLLRHCYQLLERAEHSVALLTGTDEQGNPITAPFDATATLDSAPAAGAPAPHRPAPAKLTDRPGLPHDDTDPSSPPF